MKKHLREIVTRFPGTEVAVMADLVLDEFLSGEIVRVSREAPVLIIDYRGTERMPGGGANAVNNLRALGGAPLPVGVVGDDEAGGRLVALLREAGIDTGGIARVAGYATPTKTRVLAGLPHSRQQQVIRIDRGAAGSAPAADAGVAAERAVALLSGAKGLLLSDYGYGLVTPATSRPVIEEARRRGLVITCDSRHRLKEYRGVSAVTPNLEEAEELLGMRLGTESASLEPAARRLLEKLSCTAVLITRGRRGMTILEDGVKPFDIPVFGSDQVSDVTGAGDTVIAAFTLALAAGATYRQAATLANCAAGLVVMKKGTATVSAEELLDALERIPDPSESGR